MNTHTTCAHCGAPFKAVRVTATYCSARCRVAAQRARKAEQQHPAKVEWHGDLPSLRGDRLDLALRAAEIIATYDGRVTLRQGYYRLVAENAIPNTERDYKRLGGIVRDARLHGVISWDSIEDRGRSIEKSMTYSSVKEAREMMRAIYNEDRWDTQARRVAVIVEKAALAGVIEPVCRKWQVPFVAARGYASSTLVAEVSLHLRDHDLLYLGDHDPSGADMSRDWQTRLDGFGSGCTIKRIALTREQIAELDLPPQPVKTSDARANAYRAQHGDGVWELDAMPPDTLVALVERCIIGYINMKEWERRDARIEANRARL
jgi:hypothetical protein